MIFIEPQSAYESRTAYGPQATGAPLRGVQHRLAPVVMAAMNRHGNSPIGLWKMVNGLVRAENVIKRGDVRYRRLCFVFAVRELLRVRLLYRHCGFIAKQDFAFRPRPKPAKSVLPSVGRTDCQTLGSNGPATPVKQVPEIIQPAQFHLLSASPPSLPVPAKTEYAKPTIEEISAAASLIAMQPRYQNKKWSGYIHGKRIRRRSLFALPTGETLPAMFVLRGKVYVYREGSERFIDRFDGREVVRIKNPAAVLLGRLKRGKHEEPSERKASAARRNGSCPPRPGSRPRGRPRRVAVLPG